MSASGGGAGGLVGPPRRLRRLARPEQALGRVAVGLMLVLAWSTVGHESGSGWVVALGGVVAATLALGFLGPPFALARASVSVIGAPADVEAGQPVEIELRCSRRVRVQGISPAGPPALTHADRAATVTVVPERRGVTREVVLRVASAAPFGLVWWSREVLVPLPRPLFVAPRLGSPLPFTETAGDGGTSGGRAVRSVAGELRAVREYRHGDSPRRVHWPATAHATTLMVRETDDGGGAIRVVRGDLPTEPQRAEERAEHLLGTIVELLGAGERVQLETTEDGGRRVVAPVTDRRGAGRRLAVARAAPPAAAPPATAPGVRRGAS